MVFHTINICGKIDFQYEKLLSLFSTTIDTNNNQDFICGPNFGAGPIPASNDATWQSKKNSLTFLHILFF